MSKTRIKDANTHNSIKIGCDNRCSEMITMPCYICGNLSYWSKIMLVCLDPDNIFRVTDQSINCHIDPSAMNYLLNTITDWISNCSDIYIYWSSDLICDCFDRYIYWSNVRNTQNSKKKEEEDSFWRKSRYL